jgi:hypothetical protein
MNRFKVLASIFCLSLAALAFSASVKADAWNKKTIVTFSQPVEVPGGVVLPPSTYVFKLLDSASNRHIVQIFNEDQTHIYATVLAIPNYRLRVTGKTVITFTERAANRQLLGRGFIREIILGRNLCIGRAGLSSWLSKPIRPCLPN